MKRVPILGTGIKGKSPTVTSQRRLNCYQEIRPDGDKAQVIVYGTPGLLRWPVGIIPPYTDTDCIDFGTVTDGSSDEVTLTITNNSAFEFQIVLVNIFGTDAAQFDLTTDPSGQYLGPGESATVGVTFTPAASGTYSASLLIETNATDQIFICLVGESQESAAVECLVFSWDASTLSLTPSLGPAITLSRASRASYINSSGAMLYATNNSPRWDYHPMTGVFRGLLIERSSTNYIANSNLGVSLGAVTGWTTVEACSSTTSFSAGSNFIDGNPALLVTFSGCNPGGSSDPTSTGHGIQQTATMPAGSWYVVSLFVKRSARDVSYLALNVDSAEVLLHGPLLDDTNAGGSIDAGCQDYGGDWVRVATDPLFTTTGTVVIKVRGYKRDGSLEVSGSYLVAGVQTEVNAGTNDQNTTLPTSYINTTLYASTREADVASTAVSGITGFSNDAATVFVEYTNRENNRTNTSLTRSGQWGVFSLISADESSRMVIVFDKDGNAILHPALVSSSTVRAAGSFQAIQSEDEINKFIAGYGLNNKPEAFINGSQNYAGGVNTWRADEFGSVLSAPPVSLQTAYFGYSKYFRDTTTFADGKGYLDGYLRKVSIYNCLKPDTFMQSETTL